MEAFGSQDTLSEPRSAARRNGVVPLLYFYSTSANAVLPIHTFSNPQSAAQCDGVAPSPYVCSTFAKPVPFEPYLQRAAVRGPMQRRRAFAVPRADKRAGVESCGGRCGVVLCCRGVQR